MSVEFLNAKIFWAAMALPFVLAAIVWGLRRKEDILKEFGRVDLLSQFSRISLNRRVFYRILPTVFCLLLLILVTARPILHGSAKKIRKGALDVVAVLDVSKSMAAEDCGPHISRLETAKDMLLKVLPDLAGNRLGIVTFAGKSFPQAELTDDFQALRFVLKNWVMVDSAPLQGSNIGGAVVEASSLFEKDDKKKMILLFSDGGHVHPENLEGILADIEARQIRVVSVGLGSPSGSRIPVYENGEFKEWLKINEEEAFTRLNEEILREIAHGTGGKYVRVRSGKELEGILMDPRVMDKELLSGGREVFQIPLGLSIALLCVGMYFERRSV